MAKSEKFNIYINGELVATGKSMIVKPLNRECPNCKNDCGAEAVNYPPAITNVLVTHICESCKCELYSDFKYPLFFWSKLNN
jgi:MinD superfamily P-loop ATPase